MNRRCIVPMPRHPTSGTGICAECGVMVSSRARSPRGAEVALAAYQHRGERPDVFIWSVVDDQGMSANPSAKPEAGARSTDAQRAP